MSKLFGRVTNIFKRNPSSSRQTSTKPTPNPYGSRNTVPNRNRAAQTEEDDGSDDTEDDDERSIQDEYTSTRIDTNTQPMLPRLPNPANTLPTPLPTVNNNDIPQPTPQPPIQAPRPERTPNQPSIPPMPIAPVRRNLKPLFDRPRRPLRISPNSTLIGFPTQATQRPNRFASHSQFVNYEYDYPIENVVIDGNIPSSMAMKINRAVEHDRFGHPQQIKRSYPSGTRRIREIPLQNNSTVPQLIIHQIPRIDDLDRYDPVCYPRPIHHYVALSCF